MLAALPYNSPPMSDVSNLGSRGISAQPDSPLLNESRLCPGCKKSVITEVGGVVVAFGSYDFVRVITRLALSYAV
ncbi:hypothetical protein BKA93DRAFT_780517 [Sparassis latifolia]